MNVEPNKRLVISEKLIQYALSKQEQIVEDKPNEFREKLLKVLCMKDDE